MLWRKVTPYLLLAVCTLIALYALYPASSTTLNEVHDSPSKSLSTEEIYPHVIEKNSSLYVALRKLNVDSLSIQKLVKAAKPENNLARLMPGTRFRLVFEEEPVTSYVDSQEVREEKAKSPVLKEMHILTSTTDVLKIYRLQDQWFTESYQEPVEIEPVTFSGIVQTSLWESADAANMNPELIGQLSEIFAWQIDFAREVRRNDRWRIMVEKKMVRGETVGWGDIRVAEYENEGRSYKAILFEKEGELKGYFSPEGKSLRKMFLKSPIKFARISSRFQRRRFHPILKVNRPHLGVDYAAPIGTPVRAVGAGRVTYAGWRGGGGKTIKIRHNSVYKTAYKHLNGYAKGIRRGKRVEQGQIIGYVGTTGLSTGPHLHFEFFKHGKFVDPLRQEFPSADPIPKKFMAEFQAHSNEVLQALPDWQPVSELSANF
tara:strand:- start:1594 stop:2883 length:1290 start_codon:yes stop_codon:yes gene_type:complete